MRVADEMIDLGWAVRYNPLALLGDRTFFGMTVSWQPLFNK